MKLKVLLLKDVAKLGWKWQIVEVSDAVFRNVLKPKAEAKLADKKVIKEWEKKQEKQRQEIVVLDKKKDETISKLKNNWLEIFVQTSPNWHLYEKIDIRHIQNELILHYGVKFENKEIDFPEKKISKIWEYNFFIKRWDKKVSIILKVLTKKP